MPSAVRRLLVGLGVFLWVGAVAGGFAALIRHESGRGAPAAPPQQWPAAAPIERSPGQPTLLVFIHPQCPCTPATIEELDRLLTHCGDKVHTEVFCYSDPALGSDWAHGGNWDAAAAIPGVVLHEDPLGAAARAFGAKTSGQVCLYDAKGTLRFEGGITPARAHAGDNDGEDAVQDLLMKGTSRCTTSAVFGCSLIGTREGNP